MKHTLLNLLYRVFGFENYIHIANVIKYKLIRFDSRKALYFHFLNRLKPDANTLPGQNLYRPTLSIDPPSVTHNLF